MTDPVTKTGAAVAVERRRDPDPPSVTAKLGWRYHHLGVPYSSARDGEKHLKELKVFVCGFDTSPYGIEWMRFEPECPVPDLVRNVPHIAFEVPDLDEALAGKEIVFDVSSPSEGVRTAMIVDDGFPVELIEFRADRGAE